LSEQTFKIDVDFLPPDSPTSIEACAFGEISISAGEICLTALQDFQSRTTRNSFRASAYVLAEWFASNFWRLTQETVSELEARSTDWKMAHMLASSGHGYAWPEICFEGLDGEVARVKALNYQSPTSTIRYLSSFEGVVTAASLESSIVQFVETVIARLYEFGKRETSLKILWDDVLSERRSTRNSKVRRMEALLGLDADERTEFVETLLSTWSQSVGQHSLEEIAASSHAESIQAVLAATDHKSREIPLHGKGTILNELRARIPVFDPQTTRPWIRSRQVAYQLREAWGLSTKPVSDKEISELLEIPLNELAVNDKNLFFPFAVQDKDHERFGFALSRSKPESRRFEIARLLGDQLMGDNSERLIPATSSSTLRQKMQRSFAAEFLCPSNVVRERTNDVQTGDELVKVLNQTAEDFNVAEAVVSRHYENRWSIDHQTSIHYY
jgi:Zn-dependent peptidase ImmA (M78 family)